MGSMGGSIPISPCNVLRVSYSKNPPPQVHWRLKGGTGGPGRPWGFEPAR
jgi:hypothetical protein